MRGQTSIQEEVIDGRFIEIIKGGRSIRRYQDWEIPEEHPNQVLEAIMRLPF